MSDRQSELSHFLGIHGAPMMGRTKQIHHERLIMLMMVMANSQSTGTPAGQGRRRTHFRKPPMTSS